MKSNLLQQPLRLLVLGALFSVPLATMANTLVSIDRSENAVPSSDTWLSLAGGRFGENLVEREHPKSFALAARERMHGKPAGAAVLSHDGAMTHRAVWPVKFLPDTSTPSPVASVTSPVPEPGTYVLMLAGLAAVGFVMHRRRRS